MDNIVFFSSHNHPIEKNIIKEKECNICLEKINSEGYSCIQCNTNICLPCSEKLINLPAYNPKIHKDKLEMEKRAYWRCDFCCKVYHRQISMYCEKCDFDCCISCYSKGDKPVEIYHDFDIKNSTLLKKIENKEIEINVSLLLNNGDIIIGFEDGEIYIIDKEILKEKLIIKEFSKGISDIIQCDNKKVFVCGKDKVIKIFLFNENFSNYNIEDSFQTNSIIKRMFVLNEKILVLTEEKSIEIYEKNKENIFEKKNEKKSNIDSMIIYNSKIYALSSEDKSIKIIDINTFEILKSIEEINVSESYMYILNNDIIIGGKKLIRINSENDEIKEVNELIENIKILLITKLKDNSLVFVINNDQRYDMEQWKLNKEQKYEKYGIKKQIHDKEITSIIQMNDGSLLTTSKDFSIKIWI